MIMDATWDLFLTVKQSLQKKVSQYENYVLHYCNKPFIGSNQKFDEVKQFQQLNFMKKYTDIVQCLEFFRKCNPNFEENENEFEQN